MDIAIDVIGEYFSFWMLSTVVLFWPARNAEVRWWKSVVATCLLTHIALAVAAVTLGFLGIWSVTAVLAGGALVSAIVGWFVAHGVEHRLQTDYARRRETDKKQKTAAARQTPSSSGATSYD